MTLESLIAQVDEVARLRERAIKGGIAPNAINAFMYDFNTALARIDFAALHAELVRLREVETRHAAAIRECEQAMEDQRAQATIHAAQRLNLIERIHATLTGAP
jgi:hypothetical protein